MAIEFYQTYMGRSFYENQLPSLIRELKRLNENLEKMQSKPDAAAKAYEAWRDTQPPEEPKKL